MAGPKFDRARAIRVLVDAEQFGDGKACETWGINRRTLTNYRERLRNDPELSHLFQKCRSEEEQDWKLARQRFLREGIDKLRELIAQATVKQLGTVAKAIELIGNLDVASQALSHVSDIPNLESPTHPAYASHVASSNATAPSPIQ